MHNLSWITSSAPNHVSSSFFIFTISNSLLYYSLYVNGQIVKANSNLWICKTIGNCWYWFYKSTATVSKELLCFSALHYFCQRGSQKWPKPFGITRYWNSWYFKIFNNKIEDILLFCMKKVGIIRYWILWP